MTTTGFELILPFLRPIQHLILDPEISEIMVNGPDHVFIERSGKRRSNPRFDAQLQVPRSGRQKYRAPLGR